MSQPLIGLLGWPVEHSLSPDMHNAAFAALRMDWRYDLLPTPPDRLGEAVRQALGEGYRGFNVTIPHKRAVLTLPQLQDIEPAVEAIGAANTLISLPGGGLRATNTDWYGFRDDLQAHGIDPQGLYCLVLGTGGAARAVAYALSHMGARQVRFASRQPQPDDGQIGYDALGQLAPSFGLIVNCTPLGMSPHDDASPWPEDVPLPGHAVLYDLVYTPPVTWLMAQARLAGARAVGGLGMLARQGAESFRQWTGADPPLAIMQQAAQRALMQRETRRENQC